MSGSENTPADIKAAIEAVLDRCGVSKSRRTWSKRNEIAFVTAAGQRFERQFFLGRSVLHPANAEALRDIELAAGGTS